MKVDIHMHDMAVMYVPLSSHHTDAEMHEDAHTKVLKTAYISKGKRKRKRKMI